MSGTFSNHRYIYVAGVLFVICVLSFTFYKTVVLQQFNYYVSEEGVEE